MNLSELFEMQRVLDERIEKEHPRKEDENRLAKKILALQVELGEFANEWRGFKFWSNDREPRTEKICPLCDGTGQVNAYWSNYDNDGYLDVLCPLCESEESDINPLLEEYVDCLHFALSIGLEILDDFEIYPGAIVYGDVTDQFNELFGEISYLACVINRDVDYDEIKFVYERVWSILLGLAISLSFSWKQIEEAYRTKNEINHTRQSEGY